MSDEEEEPREPKIIVDDDWKEQVAREKEQARHVDDEGGAESDSGPTEAPPHPHETRSAAADQSTGETAGIPPANFETLLSMFFTQGMAMLGQVPDPQTGETEVNKAMAKHTIDTLDMLAEKTKGNLDDDEARMLSEALHALRMAFVSVKG